MAVLQPAVLFKYHADNEYLETMLANSELFYSPASIFNDPAEFKFTYLEGISLDEFEKSPNKPIGQTLRRNFDPQTFFEVMKEKTLDAFSQMGVCCFAHSPYNYLMWSHYAKSHTGVCLIFDAPKDREIFMRINPVVYADTIPYLDFRKPFLEEFVRAVTTKAACWAYEEEWRGVKGASGIHKFNKQALIGVVFGQRMQEERKDVIKEICAKHGLQSSFFDCVFEKNSYNIELRHHPAGEVFNLVVPPYKGAT
ncbi:MAG: DUF2971 domain-containing protein [Saprospiraceae bacterium]